jgi:transmembrane sensor
MNMANSDAGSSDISPDDWERIARYLTGEAGASEADVTKRWIEADPHRVEMVRLLESVLANVSREDASGIDVESALTRVKKRFDERKVIPLATRFGTAQRANAIASVKARPAFAALMRVAAATIIIVGGTMLWQNLRRSRADAARQTFATSVGERRQIALKDGSKVLLGPTSRLIVPATEPESGSDRLVALDGVAYFSVVHDPAHPFTVKAGDIVIQDVGTAFSVDNDDSAGTRVVVDSGSVSIGAAASRSNDIVLNARDRATVDTRGIVAIERSAVSDDDLAWVQGRLVFRDAPLVLVGAELYRWYGVRLRVADSSLANLHLTASFSGEPVDRVLNVIALSLGARIERQGNVAILHRTMPSGARP